MKHYLPQKYTALKKAENAGIFVPKTLLVNTKTEKKEIDSFIKYFSPRQKYIVRSAICGEDGNYKSFAGYFFSSEAVGKKMLHETIQKTLAENKMRAEKYHLKNDVFCLLQPFYTTKCGGVLLSKWKFFPNYFLGEITDGGPQNAVEGKKNLFFLLHKTEKKDVLPLPKKWEKYQEELQKTVQKIEKVFNFVADIEWGITKENTCIVFQIRPITAPIEALFPAEKEKIPPGHWQKNALAESLGVLSPLSFSCIQTLFLSNRKILQKYGIKAEKEDFLWRAPNGEIFVDPEKESIFWKNKNLFSVFIRNAKREILLEHIWKKAKREKKKMAFSYKKIEKIFSWWLLSNLFVKKIYTKKNYTYELLEREKIPFPVLPSQKNWKNMNSFLREWFFFELEKMKKEISKKPEMVFMNCKEWKENTRNISTSRYFKRKKEQLQKREEEQIEYSLYDFSSLVYAKYGEKMQKAAGKSIVMGETYIIENPYIHTENIPFGVILVAPFFRNEWIEYLPHLSGVVLEQGGMLSHSAIVAREKNIPYFFHVENAVKRYKNSKKLILDCQTHSINIP